MYGGQIKVKGNDNSEVISYHVTYKLNTLNGLLILSLNVFA